ncbi:hypothetical protein A6R68_05146, partial [Neotoma lepida]
MEESTSKLTEAISEPTVVVKDELKNSNLSNPLGKAKSGKRVEWSSDTIDNEHLGRRSSKCCCVYERPRAFGESSSDSEEDDDNCTCTHKSNNPIAICKHLHSHAKYLRHMTTAPIASGA